MKYTIAAGYIVTDEGLNARIVAQLDGGMANPYLDEMIAQANAHDALTSALRQVIACVDPIPADRLARAAIQNAIAVLAPSSPPCPHGKTGECNACDIAGDFAYDAAREDRAFGRR